MHEDTRSIVLNETSDFVPIVRDAIKLPEEDRVALISRIVAPHYEVSQLEAYLKRVYREYRKLSFGCSSNAVAQAVFTIVFRLYEIARAFEKSKKPERALDYYVLILFTFVPSGSAYFERPAIILESMKQYGSALAVCALWRRSLDIEEYMRSKSSTSSNSYLSQKDMVAPEISHRIARLESKLRSL